MTAGFSPHQLLPFLQHYPTTGRRWVALSGGVDSTVLLHALAQLSLGDTLQAIHIHHGLQAEADGWVTHCQQLCKELHLPLTTLQVDATPAAGESPEAVAREARYRAFESVLTVEDQLFTAHHQEDQAETFLLRALRGSGPRGLAAMREARPLGESRLLRPLLKFSQQALIDYAESQQLSWIEDPSNRELDADRNFLRLQILPLLRSRWPAVAATLSRSASHCAESDTLLQQWGSEQLASLSLGEPLPLIEGEARAVSKVRIRSWLELNQIDSPDTIHMERILNEVIPAREDAMPLVEWRAVDGKRNRLRRFQQALYIEAVWGQRCFEAQQTWDWNQLLRLSDNRVLQASQAESEGLSMAVLQRKKVTVRWRSGGERCQPSDSTQRRTLKNILRERAVPPWEREQIPLIFVEDQLAQVVGHFICQGFVTKQGEQGLKVETITL